MILTIIFLIVIYVTVAKAIRIRNRLRRLEVKISESESGIDVALASRYDTLTKMLDVCRQYTVHELDTFSTVIALRKGMTMEERREAAKQMKQVTEHLNVVLEAYPQLKSSEVFGDLQNGIQDAEAHLQAARRLYNANISAFNQALVVYPASIIGNMMKLKSREFFEIEDIKRVDVTMKI